MCAHFILIPEDELQEIITDMLHYQQTRSHDILAKSYQHAYPKAKSPILVLEQDHLEMKTMQWGYSVSWQSQVVFNTKIETALREEKNMWSDSIRNRRCIIPSFGFYETHRKDTHPSITTGRPVKDQYYFQFPDSDIVWMAGVYYDRCFSVMTTAPNQWMMNIHPRMPLVLRTNELNIWLFEEYALLANREELVLESVKVAS